MGKLNLVISDELDGKFRLEIAKRLGMKKGNLTKAIEEAMEMWINRPTVEKLKAQAMSKNLLVSERKEATELLGEIGDSALDALLEIGSCDWLLVSERKNARQMTGRILKNKKQLLV